MVSANMRLLWYGESPNIETGGGQVAKHLLPVFREFFSTIHLVAINQWWETEDIDGLHITHSLPGGDILNMEVLKRAILRVDDYDCLFLTADINHITALEEEILYAKQHDKKIIMYAATDSNIYSPSFYRILELADIPVVFSFWSQRVVKRMVPELNTTVIYHGCEPGVFYPLEEEERREYRKKYFGIVDDSVFLALNVNRNQVRKDLARSMAAFHLFHLECPGSRYYLHAKQQDFGGNVVFQAKALGLQTEGENSEIIFSPKDYNETSGYPRDELNRVYNCSDVFFTTSTGEGWGFSTTEAMAAGVPFIGPSNTVFREQMGDVVDLQDYYGICERGILVRSGGPNLWAVFYGFVETPRELCSTTGMRDALLDVYKYREQAKERAVKARKWTLEHTWMHAQDEWRDIFESILG